MTDGVLVPLLHCSSTCRVMRAQTLVMKLEINDCCVLNQGRGSWAFDPLARQLSAVLGIPVSAEPRRFNYLLDCETLPADDAADSFFIPLRAIRVASDKRLIAAAFHKHEVPAPRTVLLETFREVMEFVTRHSEVEWCLKFPTGCGAAGHRLITSNSMEPRNPDQPQRR